MKTLLVAMVFALLMVGCGGGEKSGSDSSESNQSTAETHDAKTAQVEEINLDDPANLDKIIAGAIDFKKLQIRGEEGEKLAFALNRQTPYSGWVKAMYNKWADRDVGPSLDTFTIRHQGLLVSSCSRRD